MNCYKLEKGFNVKYCVITLSVLMLIAYGIFNARNLIVGPSIEMYNPTVDAETAESVFSVKGKAENITFISINEKPVFVDTEGLFEEKLLLSPGSNTIEIKARDRFRNEVKKTMVIYYNAG